MGYRNNSVQPQQQEKHIVTVNGVLEGVSLESMSVWCIIVIRAASYLADHKNQVPLRSVGHDRALSAFRASSFAFCAFAIDDLTPDPDADADPAAPARFPILALDGGRGAPFAAFIAAIARNVVPLFRGPVLAFAAGAEAAATRSSETFLMNGLGRFSTSLKSYLGSGACASEATSDTAAVFEAPEAGGGAADEDATVGDDAARFILVRAELEDEPAGSGATTTGRSVADAELARMEGRRSLVGLTAGATVNVALVVLEVLAVDCVGVLSPSELSLSFSRLHARGLLSVS